MSSPSRELGSEMGFYLMETVVRGHGEEVDERKLQAPSLYILVANTNRLGLNRGSWSILFEIRTNGEGGGGGEREHVTIASLATARRIFTPTSTRLIVADSADVGNK